MCRLYAAYYKSNDEGTFPDWAKAHAANYEKRALEVMSIPDTYSMSDKVKDIYFNKFITSKFSIAAQAMIGLGDSAGKALSTFKRLTRDMSIRQVLGKFNGVTSNYD